MTDCSHPLCALIGGACSITVVRSRGCTPMLGERAEPDYDELRALLDAPDRAAAIRIAELVRREALAGGSLLARVRVDEPELAPELARLTSRGPR